VAMPSTNCEEITAEKGFGSREEHKYELATENSTAEGSPSC
jgi:hypothetical protein